MTAAFVAVDWGTSSFRLWVMDASGQVLSESRGPEGMAQCAETGFAPVLARHLELANAPEALPILICGMAGARQGWVEVPYADLPAPVSTIAAGALRLPQDALGKPRDIRILPGLAQRDPTRPDVMRGEETQLLGLAGLGVSGVVCMPGTHCKWAMLQGGAVTSFTSHITGELFELLSRQSILRHAMPETRRVAPEDAAFLEAVDEALADPASLGAALFPLRAANLLDMRSKEASLARLSGLLIGAEVAQQIKDLGQAEVTLLGQAGLGPLYEAALIRAGRKPKTIDADQATRRGLLSAATEIWRF